MKKDFKKWQGLINSRPWCIQKYSDRIKIFDDNYEFIYRLTIEEWNIIRKQFITSLRKNNLA